MAPAWCVPSAQTSAIIGWVAGKVTCQPSMLKWCGSGTPEATQASLMLSAMQEETTTPALDPTLALPEVEVQVSTDPTPPTPGTTEDTGEIL